MVFVSTEFGIYVPKEMVHYGFSKGAQLVIARGAAEQTKGTNVTVNSVLPGPTWVEMAPVRLAARAQAMGTTTDDLVARTFTERRPASLLQRYAKPEEVANLICYLCSEGLQRHQRRRAPCRRRHRDEPVLETVLALRSRRHSGRAKRGIQFALQSRKIRLRPKTISRAIPADLVCPALRVKIFLFTIIGNVSYFPRPAASRGALRNRHECGRRMRWTPGLRLMNERPADGEIAWS